MSEKSEAPLPDALPGPPGGSASPADVPPAGTRGAAPEGKPARRRKWRRRLLWAAAIAIGFALVARIALSLAMPSILSAIASSRGFRCEYERLHLSILTGEVALWHLLLASKEGSETYAEAEYATIDLAMLPLLGGRIAFRRIEADGIDVFLTRKRDGSIPFLDRLRGTPPPHAKPESPPERGKPPDKVDLRPPIRVDAMRLQLAHFYLRDETCDPPLETRLDLNVRLSDLGSPKRPARFLLTAHSNELLDALQAEGVARGSGNDLDIELRALVRGLRLEPASSLLEPLGFRPAPGTAEFRAQGRIATRSSGERPGAISVSASFGDFVAAAAGEPFLTLESLSAEVSSLGPLSAEVRTVTAARGRLYVERTPSGDLRVGPVAFAKRSGADRGSADSPEERSSPSPTPQALERPESPRASSGPGWSAVLEKLELEDMAVVFRDRALEPEREIPLKLLRLEARNAVLDPARPEEPLEIEAQFTAPGVFQAAKFRATASPFGEVGRLDAAVEAEGIAPEAIGPYLAEMGLEPALRSGRFQAALGGRFQKTANGGIEAALEISNLKLEDEEELAAIERVYASGAVIPPALIALGEIEIAEPRLRVRREATGSLLALGFRTRPLPISSAPACEESARPGQEALQAKPAEPGASGGKASAPRAPPSLGIALGQVLCRGARVEFTDETFRPPVQCGLEDGWVQIEGLRLFAHSPEPAEPASIEVAFSAPGILKRCAIEGTFAGSLAEAELRISASGEGLTAAALAPYLEGASVRPAMENGTLRAELAVRASIEEGLRADLEVRGVRYADGEARLVELDRFRIAGLSVRPSELSAQAIEVEGPRAWLRRDAEGKLQAAGFAWLAGGSPGSGGGNGEEAAPKEPEARAARDSPAAADAPAAPEPTSFVLGGFRLSGLEVHWKDDALKHPIETALKAEGSIENLKLARGADPAKIRFSASVDQLMRECKLEGLFRGDPEDLSADLSLAATGLFGKAISAYLPAGVRSAQEDGHFQARLEAGLGAHPSGGRRLRLALRDLEYASEEARWLALEAFRLAVDRFDPEGGLIDVEEISLGGLECAIEKNAEGELCAFGFAVSKSETPPEAPPPPRELVPRDEAADRSQASHLAPEKLPLIRVRKFDWNLRSLSMRDRTKPGAAPLVLSDFRLFAPEEIQLLGDDPASKPSTKVRLTGAISPLARALEVNVEATPFAAEPVLELKASLEGIRGEGLTELAPELAEKLDGSALRDGRAGLSARVEFSVGRIGPTRYDLSREFGCDIQVKGLAFRNGAEGPVLLGADALEVAGLKFDPQKSRLRVGTIEILTPRLRAYREKEGIRVLDLLVKSPPPEKSEPEDLAPQGAPEKSPPPPAEMRPPPPAETPEKAQAEPPAELSIEKFLVSGADVRFEDRSVDPPTLIPIEQFELDVRGISNRLFAEERSLRFALFVGSGKVPLPKPLESNALLGLLSDAANVVAGRGAERELEERPLFGDITASGNLTFYPEPSGWVRLGLSAFELEALKGSAAASGITLGGGMLDAKLRADLAGGSLNTSLLAIFTDLVVSEPPDGPIFRYLHLPAPLQTVVFALRNESGELRLPLDFRLEKGQITAGAAAEAAIGCLGSLITQALAAAPLRAANTVTSLATLGMAGGIFGRGYAEVHPVELEFAPGATNLSASDLAPAEPLLERIRRGEPIALTLRHQLSAEDLRHAARLANPEPSKCLEILAGLKLRQREVQKRRTELAERVRMCYGAGLKEQAEKLRKELLEADRELGNIESSLDRLYDRLRPGAERFAARRTREAALALGRARLEAVRKALEDAFPGAESRIVPLRPEAAPVEGLSSGRVIIEPQIQKAQ